MDIWSFFSLPNVHYARFITEVYLRGASNLSDELDIIEAKVLHRGFVFLSKANTLFSLAINFPNYILITFPS